MPGRHPDVFFNSWLTLAFTTGCTLTNPSEPASLMAMHPSPRHQRLQQTYGKYVFITFYYEGLEIDD